MILCASCNARNADRSTFCIRCGGALSTPAQRDPGDHTDAFSVQPEHTPAGLIDAAAAQLAEGRTQPAIENCRRAIALSPGEVEAHAILGMAYEQQGETAAALEAYETVVALAPQRNAERQKAALLRLRMGSLVEEPRRQPTRAAAPTGPLWPRVQVYLERVKALVATNPPLYAGIASGLVIFLLGTILLVHANQNQASRQAQAEYAQEIQLADQALVNEQYIEASAHYAAAWRLRQDDPTVLTRWNQAFEASTREQQAAEIAQIPKYIPNLTGRNPFEPVPIGGTGVALPPPANPALPPPTAPTQPAVAAERPPMAYETVRETARQLPPTQNTKPSDRRQLPSPFGQPITPVPAKNTKPAPAAAVAATPAAPPVDTAPKGPKGEITIWVSDKPATRQQAAPAPAHNNADSLRSRGESAAAGGRTDEAINYLNQAISAYGDRARQDPSSASISSRAAESCRARINVLRNGQ
ncbi:MAG: tetratricopeptide repeat protein [Armatimonadota bacterium]